MVQVSIPVSGMSCASCVGRVEQTVSAAPGISEVSVSLACETVWLSADNAAQIRQVAARLEKAGYAPQTHEVEIKLQSALKPAEIERLAEVPGVLDMRFAAGAKTVLVKIIDRAADLLPLMDILEKAGHSTQIALAEDRAAPRASDGQRVLWALLLALPVIVLEMGQHVSIAMREVIDLTLGLTNFWLLQLAATTALVIGPGRGLFWQGLSALLRGKPDTNSLIAIGAGSAWIYSSIVTLLPDLLPEVARQVYFEAAAAIILLVLIGRLLEARAKSKANSAIQALAGLQVKTARLLKAGATQDIPIEKLQVGDRVVIRPGERLPADGIIEEGISEVDESMLSGEPFPIKKSPGDSVTGGTVNGSGGLTMIVQKVGRDTVLSQIVQMAERAQRVKLPVQQLADRVTYRFVPIILFIAIMTAIVWLMVGGVAAIAHAMVAAVSVLIVACPCAMGLATPLSVMVGTGRAAEMGVLFRGGDSLQYLASVRQIVLDKTGTLTAGSPQLAATMIHDDYSESEVIAWAASVEDRSEHPVADALRRAAAVKGLQVSPVENFVAQSGLGAEGRVDGHHLRVGSKHFMTRNGIDIARMDKADTELAGQGMTIVCLAVDDQLAAIFGIEDAVKHSSQEVIAALSRMGCKISMMTGDRREAAHRVASEVGIDEIAAELWPSDKAEKLAIISKESGPVAFVGDGINDSAALAAADVGIAIGTGSDIAIESADVVLVSGDLAGIVHAIHIARRTMRSIRQNLAWAFGYNIALVPIAAGLLYPAFGILLSPAFAAMAMMLSSLSVLLNALRLRGLRPVLVAR
ncbi:MAG: heavy metal translocating P-type ATPase [Rhodobacteraceae bacterium]|nr:heavy metal translocating P-type ATPase [Paracoccaceae bacterium]